MTGAGHGIGVLGFIEVFLLPKLVVDGLTFSIQLSYEDRLGAGALISLIGQLMLISSYLMKIEAIKLLTQLLSISTMWVGFIYLTYDFTSNAAATLGLITGIPFLILSMLFIVRQLKHFIVWKVEGAESK
jgi:hypothetical protein